MLWGSINTMTVYDTKHSTTNAYSTVKDLILSPPMMIEIDSSFKPTLELAQKTEVVDRKPKSLKELAETITKVIKNHKKKPMSIKP